MRSLTSPIASEVAVVNDNRMRRVPAVVALAQTKLIAEFTPKVPVDLLAIFVFASFFRPRTQRKSDLEVFTDALDDYWQFAVGSIPFPVYVTEFCETVVHERSGSIGHVVGAIGTFGDDRVVDTPQFFARREAKQRDKRRKDS